jgi:hypothetical protein
MSVLVEAITLIVKKPAVHEKYQGGWEAFVTDVPNGSLCADDALASISFMALEDVESYIKLLEKKGLTHLIQDEPADMVIADQVQGLKHDCHWCYITDVDLHFDPNKRVTGCRSIYSQVDQIFVPEGWEFEGSISQHCLYVDCVHFDKCFKYLRHEDGKDIYHSVLVDNEIFVKRSNI